MRWWRFVPDDDSQKGLNFMEQKVIILSANAWSITDDSGKVTNEGVTVFYLPASDLNPVKHSDTSFGYVPLKVTMPLEFIDVIDKQGGCPAVAIAHNVIKTKSGQQVIVPDSFSFEDSKK